MAVSGEVGHGGGPFSERGFVGRRFNGCKICSSLRTNERCSIFVLLEAAVSHRPETDPPIDTWMELRNRAVRRGEKIWPKERPPARFRQPGAEYTLNPSRPGWGYHVGRERGQSDPVTYISAKELREIFPQLQTSLALAEQLNRNLPRYGAVTAPQVAAFLAQAGQESGRFTRFEEDLRYGDEDPEIVANRMYAGVNGNDRPGDGYRYRGRGPMQITGRGNYRELGYENEPDALTRNWTTGLDASVDWWENRRLPGRTERWLPEDDFYGISQTVNGRIPRAADVRWRNYERARDAMARARRFNENGR